MKRLILCLCCLWAVALQAKPPVLLPVKNELQFTGAFIYPQDVSVPAEMKAAPPPHYPAEWRDRGVEGEAQVAYIINEKGRTEQVQVATATDRQFGDAAVEAVKKWRFAPAKKDGRPARVLVTHRLKFTLNP